MTETKVKPVSMKQAIYRSINDDQLWWTSSYGPVGPFKTREEARTDFRQAMEESDGNNSK